MGWVSGSPMRVLNSSVRGLALGVDHQPGIQEAGERDAVARHAGTVGRMISCMALACTLGVTTGAGE
jgi:hypothetical protein